MKQKLRKHVPKQWLPDKAEIRREVEKVVNMSREELIIAALRDGNHLASELLFQVALVYAEEMLTQESRPENKLDQALAAELKSISERRDERRVVEDIRRWFKDRRKVGQAAPQSNRPEAMKE